MRKLVNSVINGIKCQQEYIMNNDDFFERYDDILSDQIAYNRDGNKNYSTLLTVLDNNDVDYSKLNSDQLSDLWDQFLSDMADPSYNCDISLENLGYSVDSHMNSVHQIGLSEEEFEIDERVQLSKFSAGIIAKIERETNTVINSSNYAYWSLEGKSICYRLTSDYLNDNIVECINDLLERDAA